VLPSFHHIYTFMHTSASFSLHSSPSSSSFFHSYSRHKKSGKMCVMPCINFVIFYHKFTHSLLRYTLLFETVGRILSDFFRGFFRLRRSFVLIMWKSTYIRSYELSQEFVENFLILGLFGYIFFCSSAILNLEIFNDPFVQSSTSTIVEADSTSNSALI